MSKNHFAGYVEMTALLALGLAAPRRRGRETFGWIGSRRAPRVVLAYGTVAVLSLAVLVSLSRGGAVSLAVGLVAFALLRAWGRTSGSRRGRIGVMSLLLLAAGVSAVLVLPAETRQRLRSIGDLGSDTSTAFRASLWGDTLRAAAASPLVGYGLGGFADALPRFKTEGGDVRVEHAENDYFELGVEGGLVGLVLALGAVLGLAVRWRRVGEHPAPFRHALALGSAAGLAGLAVHSMVDFNLRIPSNALACTLLAAVLLARGPVSRQRRRGVVALVSLSGMALLLVAQPPSSSRRETLHAVLLTRDRPMGAALRLRQTQEQLLDRVESRPADAEMWVWLGWSRAALGKRDEGAALCAYGASLDPQRAALREAARKLAR